MVVVAAAVVVEAQLASLQQQLLDLQTATTVHNGSSGGGGGGGGSGSNGQLLWQWLQGDECHVYITTKHQVFLDMLECLTLEDLCRLVDSKLDAAAKYHTNIAEQECEKISDGKTKAKQEAKVKMKATWDKLWNLRGDGDCFFACMWGAFYLVVLGDPEMADHHNQG